MNIKKALKEKNRLVKVIQDLQLRVVTYNSIEVGNKRPYSVRETLELLNEKSNELVELKTKIQVANAPIYKHIFRLSELKSMITRIKNLDCNEGIVQDYYSRNRETPTVKEAEVSIVERDEMIRHMENQIEEIQDILDNHNQITEI
jgi:hypothetical protein